MSNLAGALVGECSLVTNPSGRNDDATFDPELAEKQEQLEEPLLFGYFAVSKEQLFRFFVGMYVVWFLLHRVADLVYFATVDAKFPDGLENLYESDEQREKAVAFIKAVLTSSMVKQSSTFFIVMSLVFFRIPMLFDDALRWIFDKILPSPSPSSCVSKCNTCLCFPCTLLRSPVISLSDIVRGTLFLHVLAVFFLVLDYPFKVWMYNLNADAGFINTLTMPLSAYQSALMGELISAAFFGFFTIFLKLCVLKCRLGWVFMWAGIMGITLYMQFNMKEQSASLFGDTAFPSANFGVGRGFDLLSTLDQQVPWVSANRIFFPSWIHNGNGYITKDASKGPLKLLDLGQSDPGAGLVIATNGGKVVASASNGNLTKDAQQSWKASSGKSLTGGKVSLRKGKHLKDELLGFARERNIGVGKVLMIDGASTDSRANAFVSGVGDQRVIGLYNTLFLGDRPSEEAADNPQSKILDAEGGAGMQKLEEQITDVDVSEEDDGSRPVWHNAPTKSMTDAEIMGILGHELGHSALTHVETGMWLQGITSFISFAAWGWMAQSPLVAGAFMFHVPCLHGGLFVWNRVAGPPFEGIMKIFTDARTRHQEYQADAYSARVSEQYANSLQTALAKLSVNSNQDPDEPYFYEALHADHPSTAKRWAAVEAVKNELYSK